MLQLYCQTYYLALKNPNIAKEPVIIRVYFVITILKLRPNNRLNSRSYKKIRDYAIILSQNLGPFLTLLLFDLFVIEDIMYIIQLESNLT